MDRHHRYGGRGGGPSVGRMVLKVAIWAVVILVIVPAALVVVAPPVVDYARGMTKETTDCRVVRVIAGDTFRLSCPGIGSVRAQLMGADTPGIRGVSCYEEFEQGVAAQWATRRILWAADEVDARIDGLEFQGRTLVQIRVDGEGLATMLVEAGHGRWDDGYGNRSWCFEGGTKG